MSSTPARAGLAAVALLAAALAPSAHADEEPVSVGYSSDAAAYVSMVYRPPVGGVTIGVPQNGVTKADCLSDYTGTGDDQSSIVYATFVAKVMTSAQQQAERPQDSIAVATGITCTLLDERDNSTIHSWTSVRPGNASYDVFGPYRVDGIKHPKICVEAWVIYGNGRRQDIEKHCDRP